MNNDYKKKPLWDQQGRKMTYHMYHTGYDDPVTAYQVLTGEEEPDTQTLQQQKDFEELDN